MSFSLFLLFLPSLNYLFFVHILFCSSHFLLIPPLLFLSLHLLFFKFFLLFDFFPFLDFLFHHYLLLLNNLDIFLLILELSLSIFLKCKNLKLFELFLLLKLFILNDFLFFILIELFELHVLVHMVTNLFFSVELKILTKLILNFEVIFPLTSIPDFDEIAVIFLIPA